MRIHSSVPRAEVDRVVAEFTDEIFQRPPQRSSVKRETRTRRIYELEVLEQKGNLFLLRCVCQAGTYIRKLFYDIGEVLAVGATMVELRRTKVGPLDEAKGIVTFHELDIAVQKWKDTGDESELRKVVWPIESCLEGIRKVVVKDSAVDAVCHGAMLAIPGIISLSKGITKGETVVLLTAKGEMIGIAEASMSTEEVQAQPKGIAFPVRRVIMDQGTYPKMWKKQDKPAHEEGAAESAPDAESCLAGLSAEFTASSRLPSRISPGTTIISRYISSARIRPYLSAISEPLTSSKPLDSKSAFDPSFSSSTLA